jgi:uncharacterized RDD family membrane protein YckC
MTEGQAGQSGEWFFSLDNEQRGPVGIEDIRYMLTAGTIGPETLVWTSGMPDWSAACTVPELAEFLAQPQGPRALQYGLTPAHYTLSYGIEYASFGQRIVSSIIDGFIVSAVTQPLILIINVVLENGGFPAQQARMAEGGVNIALGQCIAWLYFALMASSAKQATLGMMAMKLVVTDLQGRPITFARATGRHFAASISGLTCGIGYLMMLWNQRHQTLHDIIAGTLIVKRPN